MLLGLFLTGCIDTFNRETVSTQTTQVGDFQVKETIYHTGDWPDHTFERVYRAAHDNGRWIDLGDFEDESDTGIVYSPLVVDDQLIVFSSAHVFLWRPGEEPDQFNPFEAEGWYDYSQEKQINGHYDYLASDVWANNDQVLLSYVCDSCQANKPNALMFYSLDNGQTFDICLNPSADFTTCN
ncbi:MAG: hypothetical protein AB8G95_02495 [Anaerolineae bacterium]